MKSKKVLRQFKTGPDDMALNALSADGAVFAKLSGQIISVWDIFTAKELCRLPVLWETAETKGIDRMAFSADGKTLLGSSSRSGRLLRWETATGRQLLSIGDHDEGSIAAVSSADGRIVAAATNAGSIYIWETATGQVRRTLKNAGYATAMAFSPDGHVWR